MQNVKCQVGLNLPMYAFYSADNDGDRLSISASQNTYAEWGNGTSGCLRQIGVSSKSHFVQIHQQELLFEMSSFTFERDSVSSLETNNVAVLNLDLDALVPGSEWLMIDGQQLEIGEEGQVSLGKKDGKWDVISRPALAEKGPHRYGGFKDAFRNNMVLVYATKGTKAENDWYYHRAKYDAEKFYYRANGNVELIRDVDFSLKKYKDSNVIVYGNKDNHAAWDALLKGCPIQVKDNQMKVGDKVLTGAQWGAYFVYPIKDSEQASVGVVTATGEQGMKAAFDNDYLVNGTTFPDFTVFDVGVLSEGIGGVKCSGFFANDWSLSLEDLEWRE